MKVFNNLEEMNPYYNEETNTYIFSENNRLIDIKIDFDLNIESNIKACNIKACNIKARDITACDIEVGDIKSWNIQAGDISACDINARDIKSWDIKACDIKACNIKAWDIKAWDIKACSIKSRDIKAENINAWDINSNKISFYAVCFAYKTFVCNTIRGIRKKSKYFCLDSDVVIKNNLKNEHESH